MITSTPTITGEFKSSELAHLFRGKDGTMHDRHVEALFDDLFYGREIDDLFKNNFSEYFDFLSGYREKVPPEIFTDVAVCKAWIGQHFGLLHITTTRPAFAVSDPDLTHCTHFATLRCALTADIVVEQASVACAPSELFAALLAVVEVYRVLARRYIDNRFAQDYQRPC